MEPTVLVQIVTCSITAGVPLCGLGLLHVTLSLFLKCYSESICNILMDFYDLVVRKLLDCALKNLNILIFESRVNAPFIRYQALILESLNPEKLVGF